jgi:hypothetical protein
MLWNIPWKNLLPLNGMTTCLTKHAVLMGGMGHYTSQHLPWAICKGNEKSKLK